MNPCRALPVDASVLTRRMCPHACGPWSCCLCRFGFKSRTCRSKLADQCTKTSLDSYIVFDFGSIRHWVRDFGKLNQGNGCTSSHASRHGIGGWLWAPTRHGVAGLVQRYGAAGLGGGVLRVGATGIMVFPSGLRCGSSRGGVENIAKATGHRPLAACVEDVGACSCGSLPGRCSTMERESYGGVP